jgi:antitoxin component of MazEF toxin-antitoxin module
MSHSLREADMTTVITRDGHVAVPRTVLDAAGLVPGDAVDVRPLPDGGLVVERVRQRRDAGEAAERVDRAIADLRASGVRPNATTDDLMRQLRGDD